MLHFTGQVFRHLDVREAGADRQPEEVGSAISARSKGRTIFSGSFPVAAGVVLVASLLPICDAAAAGQAAAGAKNLSPASAGVARKIYVTGFCDNVVTAYPVGKRGNIAPVAPVTGLGLPAGVAVDSRGRIYVANAACNSITVYAPGSSGAAGPIETISGPHTGLNGPTGVAVDSKGKIYAVNRCGTCTIGLPPGGIQSVTVYAPGSNGDAKPLAMISGPDAGLDWPTGVAVDSQGQTYVTSSRGQAVTVYAPGSNVGPIATISGPDTGLSFPVSVAVGSTGEIYVFNQGYSENTRRITAYAPGSSGDAKPVVTISGPDTNLGYGSGIAVDSNGQIYVIGVVEDGAIYHPAVLVFASGSDGDAKPIAAVSGADTGLGESTGIAVDSKGKIYVANRQFPVSEGGSGNIMVYAPGSNGDAKPIAEISGSQTRLASPMGIAVSSTGEIYVANANGAVTVYAPGSRGNAMPMATVAGTQTLLFSEFFPSLVFSQGIAVGP